MTRTDRLRAMMGQPGEQQIPARYVDSPKGGPAEVQPVQPVKRRAKLSALMSGSTPEVADGIALETPEPKTRLQDYSFWGTGMDTSTELTPPGQIPSVPVGEGGEVVNPAGPAPGAYDIGTDVARAVKETPENFQIGTLSLGASTLNAIKRRAMQFSGGGILPDDAVRRQFEAVVPTEARPMPRNPLFRTKPQLPGSISSEAVSVVARLPDAGAKILQGTANMMAEYQDDVSLRNAPVTRLMRSVTQSGVPSMGAAIGLSVLTGSPVIGLVMLGETEGGSAFQGHLDAGGSVRGANIIGDLSEAAEIAGESLVLPKFVKGITEPMPLGKALTAVVENATQEGVTGFNQTFVSVFGREYAKDKDAGRAAAIAFDEGVRAIPENAWVGGASGGGAEAVGAVTSRIIERSQKEPGRPDNAPYENEQAQPKTMDQFAAKMRQDQGVEELPVIEGLTQDQMRQQFSPQTMNTTDLAAAIEESAKRQQQKSESLPSEPPASIEPPSAKPEPMAKAAVGSGPDYFEKEERKALQGLGYSIREIGAMDVAEGRRRIQNGIRKEAVEGAAPSPGPVASGPAVRSAGQEAPAPAPVQEPAKPAEEVTPQSQVTTPSTPTGKESLQVQPTDAVTGQKQPWEMVETDPTDLVFREGQQNRTESLKDVPTDEFSPLVVIAEADGSRTILDGHNRAAVAKDRGDKVQTVGLTRDEYETLNAAGYDDMEIAYAALSRAEEESGYELSGHASGLDKQFPGAGIATRGSKALELLMEKGTPNALQGQEEGQGQGQVAPNEIGPSVQPSEQGAGAAGTTAAPALPDALTPKAGSDTIPSMAEPKGAGGKQTPSTPQTAQGELKARFDSAKARLAKVDPSFDWASLLEKIEREDGITDAQVLKWEGTADNFERDAKAKTAKKSKAKQSDAKASNPLADLMERYEGSGEIETIADLADEVEALATDTDNQDVLDAVEEYRDAARDDREKYGMRSGLEEQAGEKLVATIRSMAASFNPTPRSQIAGTRIPSDTEANTALSTMPEKVRAQYSTGRWSQDKDGYPVLVRSDGKEFIHFHHIYDAKDNTKVTGTIGVVLDAKGREFPIIESKGQQPEEPSKSVATESANPELADVQAFRAGIRAYVRGQGQQPALPRRLKAKEVDQIIKEERDEVKVIRQLRDSADAMQTQIDAKRNPAIANQNVTARRANIAAGMASEADAMEQVQKATRAIADARENGTLPESLKGVTKKTQVDDILHSRSFPTVDVHQVHYRDMMQALEGKKGSRELRSKLADVYNGDTQYYFRGSSQIEAAEQLVKMTQDKVTGAKWLADSIKNYRRMVAAGIESETQFSQAKTDLAELMGPKKQEKTADRQIREKTAALIGVKIPGFFPTPKSVAEGMVEAADIQDGMTVLEPSAGKGDLADVIREQTGITPDTIETSSGLAEILTLKGYQPTQGDFLERQGQYDRIVMNPPYEKGQDIDHVRHAYDMLKPGGRVVALMSEGTFSRGDAKATGFREWLDEVGGTSEKLAQGSFTGKESFRQTGVAVRQVAIEKPEQAEEAIQPQTVTAASDDTAQPQTTEGEKAAPVSNTEGVETAADVANSTTTENDYFVSLLLDERTRLLEEARDFHDQIGPVAIRRDYEPQIRRIDVDLTARGYKTDRLPSYDAYMESREMREALRDEAELRLQQRNEASVLAEADKAAKQGPNILGSFPGMEDAVRESATMEIQTALRKYDEFFEDSDGETGLVMKAVAELSLMDDEVTQWNNRDRQKFETLDAAGEEDVSDVVNLLAPYIRNKPGFSLVEQTIAAPEPTPTTTPAIKNMAGQVRKSKPKRSSAPDLTNVPAKTVAAVDKAIAEKDADALIKWLHAGNKNMRKYFTVKTGVKLPRTVSGTEYTIRTWIAGNAAAKKALDADKPTESPVMRQWKHFKEKYPDTVLFFRMGDFYETFQGDAQSLHDVAGVTLTSRDGGKMKLAGVPYHALDKTLKEMLKAGRRVAVLEQVDKGQVTGKVERDVVRIEGPDSPLIAEAEGMTAPELSEEGVTEPADSDRKVSGSPGKAGAPGKFGGIAGPGMPMTMEPVAEKPPVTARQIIEGLGRALMVPIRGMATNRAGTKAGWYEVGPKGIRQVNVQSLDTTAHEIGHHIDHAFQIRQAGVNRAGHRMYRLPPEIEKGADKELLALGKQLYGDTKPVGGYKSEGIAEFVRGYLTEHIEVRVAAPKFYKWFVEDYLPDHPDVASALKEAKTLLTEWRKMGAEARIESKISEKQPKGPIVSRVQAARQWIYGALWDELVPLKTMRDQAGLSLATNREKHIDPVTGKALQGYILPEDDAFTLATYYNQVEGARARRMILNGTIDIWGNRTGKGLKEVMEPIVRQRAVNEFRRWMISARALDLISRGIDPGISKEDAQFVYDKYKDNEGWKEAAEDVTAWNSRVLDYLVQAGGLEADAAARMRELNPVYVPFLREFAKGEKAALEGVGRGVLPQGKVHGIKGSGREIIDPYQGMIQQAQRLVSLAHKTMVAKSLADLADKTPGMASIMWPVPAPKQATTFQAEQVKRQLMDLGVEFPEGGLETMDALLTVYTNSPVYRGKDNIISIVRNGKRSWYEVDPVLYRVLKGLDQFTLPTYLRWTIALPTRVMRFGATGINAAFGWVRNPSRDSLNTIFSARFARGPFATMKGLAMDLSTTGLAKAMGVKSSEAAEQYLRQGGEISGFVGQDRSGLQHVKGEMLASTVGRKTIHTVAHPLDAMRELFGISENAPRMAEYAAALKKYEKQYGKDSPNARIMAFNAASDQTINFRRHGWIGKWLNQLIPFWNAAMQDPDKIVRTFKTRGVEATAWATALLTLPAIALWWWDKDDEWYKELPGYERANYLHIQVGEDRIIRLPVPFLVGHIFQSVPVATLDALYRADPKRVTEVLGEAFKSDVGAIVNAPAFISPLLEVAANKDWSGKPIVTESMRNKQPNDQYTKYTGEFAKAIAETINSVSPSKVAPVQVQYLMNAYSGGIYGRTQKIVQTATRPMDDLQIADMPVLGTLFVRDAYAPRDSIEKFYARREKLNQAYTSDKTKMTGSEIVERTRINRAGLDLTDIWKELRDTGNEAQRRRLYGQIKGIIDSTKADVSDRDILDDIAANTYREPARDHDMGDPHKGSEDRVAALRQEYQKRTGRPAAEEDIQEAQDRIRESERQKRINRMTR